MPKPKIDRVKLSQLIRRGKSQKALAQMFDVTEGAISKAKKQLKLNVIKNVALENAGRIVDKNLNAIEQLQKINNNANEILDLLMRWNRGEEEAVHILESQVAKNKIRTDPRELAIKAMAEIRNQLGLQLDIFQTLYDLKAVQEFQEEVLTTIGEVDKDVREKIIRKLDEKRAIRSVIKFD